MTMLSSFRMADFKLEIVDPEVAEDAAKGGKPLRDLCRIEAENFDRYLRNCGHPEYAQGLAQWERFVIEGYLYQKIRGHIDALDKTGNDSDEDRNG